MIMSKYKMPSLLKAHRLIILPQIKIPFRVFVTHFDVAILLDWLTSVCTCVRGTIFINHSSDKDSRASNEKMRQGISDFLATNNYIYWGIWFDGILRMYITFFSRKNVIRSFFCKKNHYKSVFVVSKINFHLKVK